MAVIAPLQKDFSDHYGMYGTIPSMSELGYTDPTDFSGKFVAQATIEGGDIQVTFRESGVNGTHQKLDEKKLHFSPYSDGLGNAVLWSCGAATITGLTALATEGSGVTTLDTEVTPNPCRASS